MQPRARSTSPQALASLAIVGVLLVSLWASAERARAQVTDPVSVFTAFNAAVNAHDVDAALSFFADDAVVQFPNQPPPNIHRGTQEIRAWLQADAAQHIHVQTDNIQVLGDRVTGIGKVAVDSLQPLGITLEGPVEAVIQGGKITSFTFTLSQDTLAKLQAATQQPQSLPQTGGAGLGLNSLLILVALLTCGLGVLLRHRRVRQ
jgi:LPXTG-motif cell wall-anchored protein